MPPQTKSRKPSTSATGSRTATDIPADRARAALGDLLDRAGFRGERIPISRNGKRIAALVSIEDLETLEAVA